MPGTRVATSTQHPIRCRLIDVKVDWTKYLLSTPGLCGGQLCAKGTRVAVAVILDSLAEGGSEQEILRSYPTLKPVHLRAALAYAADLAREQELSPLVDHAHQARRESTRRAG
jgi:uncharacterized protein (DUF433 family)